MAERISEPIQSIIRHGWSSNAETVILAGGEFEMKKRPTKVEFLDRNGKPSELWFGSLCTDEEIQERLRDMKSVGLKVIKYYKVDHI